jgi:F0F1-type ATP synthase assembly protein I
MKQLTGLVKLQQKMKKTRAVGKVAGIALFILVAVGVISGIIGFVGVCVSIQQGRFEATGPWLILFFIGLLLFMLGIALAIVWWIIASIHARLKKE